MKYLYPVRPFSLQLKCRILYITVFCKDINECDEETDDCHVNATCFNLVPSFFCDCNFGFTGDGKQCGGKKECHTRLFTLFDFSAKQRAS